MQLANVLHDKWYFEMALIEDLLVIFFLSLSRTMKGFFLTN